jgi:hypothetical protein
MLCLKQRFPDGNIFFNSSDPNAADAYFSMARKQGNELHSVSSDPLFKDPEKGDFRLAPNSPARNLGFRPFELKAGRTPMDRVKLLGH